LTNKEELKQLHWGIGDRDVMVQLAPVVEHNFSSSNCPYQLWGSPNLVSSTYLALAPGLIIIIIIIIIITMYKYKTYFSGEITLHVAQLVHTEELQHYIP